jgi:hypothetical protein
MPRQARLDAPGTLHHVIIRGLERRAIVKDDVDREAWASVRASRFTSPSGGSARPHHLVPHTMGRWPFFCL